MNFAPFPTVTFQDDQTTMLTVDEALGLVLENVRPVTTREVALAEALGCLLAEAATSDVDSPPHDKSIVDGYAIRSADLSDGTAELRVIEEVTAGRVPEHSVGPGSATRIMTGAPIPAGADMVVMVEKTRQLSPDTVRIEGAKPVAGANIARRGISMRCGDKVLAAGRGVLTPAEIGLLAEVGRARVAVVPRPHVAVLATGDELVPADAVPQNGQIRNSNGPMLSAFVTRSGGSAHDLGIARDDRDDLRRKIADGLTFDALVLSGGVSAGVLDLVPGILAELGVVEVFHKVSLKPGKPIWFGTYTDGHGVVKPVFGLPGNPVSSLVCFELFVRPAISRLRGVDWGIQPVEYLEQITEPFTHRGDRPTFWPGVRRGFDHERGVGLVSPCKWQGSGDLRGIIAADCFICFPAGDKHYSAGDEVAVRPHSTNLAY
jgi:molybdopterin molybdotransferase